MIIAYSKVQYVRRVFWCSNINYNHQQNAKTQHFWYYAKDVYVLCCIEINSS